MTSNLITFLLIINFNVKKIIYLAINNLKSINKKVFITY